MIDVRTCLVWSIVFLSGFLFAAIILPTGGAEAVATPTATPSAVAVAVAVGVEPLPPGPNVVAARPQDEADRRDRAYHASATDTLDKVRARMRDPASVEFRNLIVVHVVGGSDTPESAAVCGEVNANNGFGAYTGFVPFIDADTFMSTADEPGFAALFTTNCTPTQSVTALIY